MKDEKRWKNVTTLKCIKNKDKLISWGYLLRIRILKESHGRFSKIKLNFNKRFHIFSTSISFITNNTFGIMCFIIIFKFDTQKTKSKLTAHREPDNLPTNNIRTNTYFTLQLTPKNYPLLTTHILLNYKLLLGYLCWIYWHLIL